MASADTAEDLRDERTIADQQDSLALVIAQVQHAQRATLQDADVVGNSEDDRVFLCGFASEDSFVGPLDDEDSITDEGIEDFICKNNLELFRRLFTDEDISTQVQAQNSCAGHNTSMPTIKLDAITTTHHLDLFSSTTKYYESQHVLLQLKRLLVSSLLGGHSLVLQRLAIFDTLYCGHPYCQFSDAPMPRGNIMLQLRLEEAPQVRHFCLGCIESVFSCQAASARYHSSLPLAPMVALDGTEEVIKAAQRLAAPLRNINGVNGVIPSSSPRSRQTLTQQQKGHNNIQNYFNPDFPFDHPSNSLQALSLRRRRDAEINQMLADVEKYNKRRQYDTIQPQKSSLVITPPPQMPGEQRYKKQGRSKWDKEKEQRVVGRRDTNPESTGTSVDSTKSTPFRICKCREPAGVMVVLRCDAEFCPTGHFHLECTKLLQKPETNHTWTCSDCSGFLEGSLVAAEASDEGEELAMDDEYDDDFIDGHDEELCNEDYNSQEDFPDSGYMSLLPGTKVSSPHELTAPSSALGPVNKFAPSDQGTFGFPATPPRHITPTNSFTPINPDRTPSTATPSRVRHAPHFSFNGGLPVKGQSAACLPVRWSEVTFEDLAPFITAETDLASHRALQPEHVGMLEQWRAACPVSRLIPRQRAFSPFRANSVQTAPLSHLLAMVEAEMAEK